MPHIGSPNYLASLALTEKNELSFAYIDLSSGDFHVTSFPLSEGAEQLRQELERLENKKVYLQNIVSKNVLGGFVLKCGEKMLDLSVQAGLRQLQAALV